MGLSSSSKWSGSTGFILASIGSAVGLGNLWRFPYIVGKYGLGTFILVYIISVLIIGIPAMILEYLVGDKLRKTPISAWNKISKKYWFIPLIPLFFLFVILSYYVVISGWALTFFVHSILNINLKFSDISEGYLSVFGAFLVILIGWYVSKKGIKSGLERVNKYLIPILFGLLLIITIFAIYTFGFSGIKTLIKITPTFFKPDTWIMALSQSFFSLDAGWLILFTYAAYAGFKYKDMIKYSFIIAFSDTIIALLASVLIFTIAVGNSVAVNQGPGFMFDTMATLLQSFPFSNIVLSVLFLILFIAAITSVVSLFEVLRAGVQDITKFKREKTTDIIGISLFVFSLFSAFSYSQINLSLNGMRILDFLDGVLIGKFAVIPVGLVILSLGWWDKTEELAHKTFGDSAKYVLILWKYVLPVFLGIVFVSQWI